MVAEPPRIFTPEYYRRLARLERRHPWFLGTRRVATEVITTVLGRPTGGLRVLDVGCGTGATLAWLQRLAGRRAVVGVDVAPAAVRLARRSGGRLVLASADALPFRDARFDLVYCADVVQHLVDEQRARALAEFRRVLRPGGAVVVRANRATGAPADASAGYASFDYRRFPAELETAGLAPVVVGTVAVLSGLTERWRRGAGGGWSSHGLAIRPLEGWRRLIGLALAIGFAGEAAAFRLRRRLPTVGASSLYAAIKVVPFERA